MIYSTKIEHVVDVQNFFHFIVHELHMGFHPDDLFEAEEGVLSAEDAKELNTLMDQCFKVCEKQDADIYAIAISSIF